MIIQASSHRTGVGGARGSGSVASTRVGPWGVPVTRTVTGVPSPMWSMTFVFLGAAAWAPFVASLKR